MLRVRSTVMIGFVIALIIGMGVTQAQGGEFECPQTGTIDNGISLTVNVRPGTYRAAVLGLSGFDPVLGIAFSTGERGCFDAAVEAEDYTVDLPSTGRVRGQDTDVVASFTNNENDFVDVEIFVGSQNGSTGEFVLLIQDLRVTSNDGAGDPFVVRVAPNGLPGYVAYEIGIDNALDPYLHWIDEDNNTIELDGGELVACDDAGTGSCWGGGDALDGSSITVPEGTINADEFDSMLMFPTEGLFENANDEFFMTLAMSSFQQGSEGRYIAAFHFSLADGSMSGGSSSSTSRGQLTPAGGSSSNSSSSAQALEATCNTSARELEGPPGTTFLVECPASCASRSLWGTGIYTDDSSVCAAGIHTGAIDASGGLLFVTIEEGQSGYRGSQSNGITSSNWGEWGRSFSVAPGS